MQTIVIDILLFILISSSFASSFLWVDWDGFHAVGRNTKVLLEHRKDLPMVKDRTSRPFTAEENRDGAMYVCFTLGQKGFGYPYTVVSESNGEAPLKAFQSFIDLILEMM